MRIGLVRHFKVNHPFPKRKLLSKADVINWFTDYDNTENLQYADVDLHNIHWQRCYSSTLIRTVNTATHIYKGEITPVADLGELNILHRLRGRIKLPFLVWGTIVRLQSFSSNNDTKRFKNGISAFVDHLISNNESDTLIVSHWFVMRELRKELIKRGLSGNNFKSNEYGTLYVFQKD